MANPQTKAQLESENQELRQNLTKVIEELEVKERQRAELEKKLRHSLENFESAKATYDKAITTINSDKNNFLSRIDELNKDISSKSELIRTYDERIDALIRRGFWARLVNTIPWKNI